MELNEKEFQVISDTDFLLTKSVVIKKMEQLFAATRAEIKDFLLLHSYVFPGNAQKITGKISKGENYRRLPYMILDYPAYFEKGNSFAYRTMFWWGNFFSCTLHLEGSSLNPYRQQIVDHINELAAEEWYVSIGETPWQYHYESDNYLLISEIHSNHILDSAFIKLSRRIELNQWANLPELAKNNLAILLRILN